MESYLYFCRRFHKSHIPKLKFKELNGRYKSIYNNIYDISEDDMCVCKTGGWKVMTDGTDCT